MKDPFEAAYEEQESPPESPAPPEEEIVAADDHAEAEVGEEELDEQAQPDAPSAAAAASSAPASISGGRKNSARAKEEEEEEEEEENMGVELRKLPTGDPDKLAKMQSILSRFSDEQMSRYESFRRSNFQKSNMKRLLSSITGCQKISVPMTIVVSGMAKMFVGELVETGRMIMVERNESGPIRPCHIREAYRRLKAEGKVPKRTVSRLFR